MEDIKIEQPKTIIEKFDEKILYQSKDGTRYNCMSYEEERLIKHFIQSEIERIAERVIKIIPKKIPMKHAIRSGSDAGAGHTIGHNALVDEIKEKIINIFKSEGIIK